MTESDRAALDELTREHGGTFYWNAWERAKAELAKQQVEIKRLKMKLADKRLWAWHDTKWP